MNVTRRSAIVLGAGALGLGAMALSASNFFGDDKEHIDITHSPHAKTEDLQHVPHGGVRQHLVDALGLTGVVAPLAAAGTESEPSESLLDTCFMGHVKYTCYDGRLIESSEGLTFDELYGSGLADEAFLVQYESVCTFYYTGDEEYLYAVIDTTMFNGAKLEIPYVCFTKYHNMAEVIEGCEFYPEIGIAKVPVDAFSEYEYAGRQVQIQLLCVTREGGLPKSNLCVTIVSDVDNDGILETKTVEPSTYDSRIAIPVIDVDHAQMFTDEDFELRIDGMDTPIMLGGLVPLSVYNSNTGEIILFMHSWSVPAIEVWVRSCSGNGVKDVVSSVLGPKEALASSVPTARYHSAEDMHYYPYGCVKWDKRLEEWSDKPNVVGTRLTYEGASIDISTDIYDPVHGEAIMNDVYGYGRAHPTDWYDNAYTPAGGVSSATSRLRWYMGHYFNQLAIASYCVPYIEEYLGVAWSYNGQAGGAAGQSATSPEFRFNSKPFKASNNDDIIHNVFNILDDTGVNTWYDVVHDAPRYGGASYWFSAFTHGLTLPGADITGSAPISTDYWKTIRSAYWPVICRTHGVTDYQTTGREFELVNHNSNDSADGGSEHEFDTTSANWDEPWRANTCVCQPGTCIHTEAPVANSYTPSVYSGTLYMRILEVNTQVEKPYVIINFWSPDTIDSRHPYYANWGCGQATQVMIKFALDAFGYATIEKRLDM